MGVPTLTMKMARGMYGHNGELVMKSVSLGDWVAESLDEYRDRAVTMANDCEMLASLRARLRPTLLASPLCNAERFARHLEEAFHGMARSAAFIPESA
jgi:predicted O-linked N-acetylglucosamine transferase (SPINDLY family)